MHASKWKKKLLEVLERITSIFEVTCDNIRIEKIIPAQIWPKIFFGGFSSNSC